MRENMQVQFTSLLLRPHLSFDPFSSAGIDAQFGEILSTLGKLSWVIAEGQNVLAPQTRATDFTSMHKRARVEYCPLGVVGVIAPWNYPFYNIMNHIASALFAGNAVIIKISEYSAWAGDRMIRLARECLAACGYDRDLVQIVHGYGETGAALVANVDKLIFTGSPGIGKLVMGGASKTLTPLVLELGGKDPFIVCDDADVDAAVTLAMRGTFQNSGQNCVGIERIYVSESRYDEFVSKAAAAVSTLRQGPAIDPATGDFREVDVGCITTYPQLGLIQALVDDAVAKGATLVSGGKILYQGAAPSAAAPATPAPAATTATPATARSRSRSRSRAAPASSKSKGAASRAESDGESEEAPSSELAQGLFYAPTLLVGVTHAMRIANEEVFGPVMCIFKVEGDSDDAAVAMANSTEYGLGATVFSASPARANAIASRLRCGMVGVNAFGLNYLVQDLPFGGVGASGFDRFAGPEGLRSCCSVKSIVTDLFSFVSLPTPVPKPLQYPVAPEAPIFAKNLFALQFIDNPFGKLKAIFGLATATMQHANEQKAKKRN
jgi:acyl-CoA reductase-like NAD-dependent aldehyde dehydrogenase